MTSAKAAVLWDESYLWGLTALRALKHKGLLYDLVRAEDIRSGALEGHALLLVPGGWASNKLKALGDRGADAIRSFVREGGNYLGLCGGAGLATQDCLGLLPVERVPTARRVPSFSGPISCTVDDHPMWDNIYRPIFHAWWPSQFRIAGEDVRTCARYDRALPDAYSSDIRVGALTTGEEWAAREAAYGINLNPERLSGEPAVVEGEYGKGRVLLSLLHFDTPDDARGNRVLRKLWTYLGGTCRTDTPEALSPKRFAPEAAPLVREAHALIAAGEKMGLWHWRTPWVLQWKRGVRGLEYCTLTNMAVSIAEHLGQRFAEDVPSPLVDELQHLARAFAAFRIRAEELLRKEHAALQQGPISFDTSDTSDDPALQDLRRALFGSAKSHGGEFKALLDEIDAFLYRLVI